VGPRSRDVPGADALERVARVYTGWPMCMRSSHHELSVLKEIARQSDGESPRRLIARIDQVNREEWRSRRWVVGLGLGVVCLSGGVGLATGDWRWLLDEAEHPVAQLVFWVGGAGLFGLVLVLGCWLRCRSRLRGLAREARRYLAGWLTLVYGDAPAAGPVRCVRRDGIWCRPPIVGAVGRRGCETVSTRGSRGRRD
jgi:hypothetical protein